MTATQEATMQRASAMSKLFCRSKLSWLASHAYCSYAPKTFGKSPEYFGAHFQQKLLSSYHPCPKSGKIFMPSLPRSSPNFLCFVTIQVVFINYILISALQLLHLHEGKTNTSQLLIYSGNLAVPSVFHLLHCVQKKNSFTI